MRKGIRRALGAFATAALACVGMWVAPATAHAAEDGYQIYPTPHSVVYDERDATQTLRDSAVAVIEDGIDADTVNRMDEALKLKGISFERAEQVPTSKGTTAVLVGVKDSGGAVDAHVDALEKSGKLKVTEGLFSKTDAYLLASLPSDGNGPDQLIVLGRDTDAAYYGLTTLYQIFQQIEGAKLRAFTACDYADVITRGFIEGYYGNPWSTEDRIALMEWGGYYKLNAYIYAPKDDPKHNKQWRDLYTDEELKNLIEPLAQAGNESKCRFVYALHPFMHNPITSGNYDASVKILKEKFTQVMDHGVRQIAILADDAANQGDALYIKLLKDMDAWLKEQQKLKNDDGSSKYPGLKDTLIFCPVNYGIGGQNTSGEAWYKQLPENIQFVNTGGRVWGKIDKAFADRFKANSGVAPFMWINWPCSDNDKDALHMGGHNNFLGSDVEPGSVKGVVLNPMQQSEPSKQGIFMNADFTWNLWESTEHADETWEDSFSYIDHNSPVASKGSNALRELSGHMKRMYGGGATWENGESADIAQALSDFRAKLGSGTVQAADIDAMVKVFTDLKQAAADFRANAGTARMLTQMEPWMATWDDLTTAALEALETLRADLSGDSSNTIAHYAAASTAYDSANGHGFKYVDHTEYARVGKLHITPFVAALMDDVSIRATAASDPDAILRRFITSREDVPTGKAANVFDGDKTTGVTYEHPNTITADTYIGLRQTTPFDLTRFTITYDSGHRNGIINTGKLQVLTISESGEETWRDVTGKTVSGSTALSVDFDGMNEKGVYGVRLIATANNSVNGSLTINELEVNKPAEAEYQLYTGTVTSNMAIGSGGGQFSNASDNNSKTEVMLCNGGSGSDKDHTKVDAYVQVTFDSAKKIDNIVFEQGDSEAGDVISSGRVSYQDTSNTWHDLGSSVTSAKHQEFPLGGEKDVKAVKVTNGAVTNHWWRVGELHATRGEAPEGPSGTPTITSSLGVHDSNRLTNMIDGDESTKFYSNGNVVNGSWVMYAFGGAKNIDRVRLVQNQPNDHFLAADVFYTTDANPNAANGAWTKIGSLNSDPDQSLDFETVKATGIKVQATQNTNMWVQVYELEAFEKYAYSADGIFATQKDGVNLEARVGGGEATASGSPVTLAHEGDVVAIDLGSVRRDVTARLLSEAAAPNGAKLVCSQNAVEWTDLAGTEPTSARYVGYRATSAGASADLSKLAVSYLDSLKQGMVSSDVRGIVADRVLDGDVKTSAKSTTAPAEGNTIVFDLGQTRAITKLEYYVPETSLDYIRNAVVEVADAPDAQDWTLALDINSAKEIDAEANKDVEAKTAVDSSGNVLFTHSGTFAGNMMIGSEEGLNVSGRYLRVRFTKGFAGRNVEIGELRINDGEYVSQYAGADFESEMPEQPGMLPSNMLDGNMGTSWAPQGTGAGSITYHVSAPVKADGRPIEGIRIISRGAPSGAEVKATVYTDEAYGATTEIALGTITQTSQEFRFGEPAARASVNFRAVKDIVLSWPEGVTPQVAEIYLLSNAPAAQETDTDALRAKVVEAEKVDAAVLTTDSAAALATAIGNAKSALDNPSTLTPAAATTLVKQLENAMANRVEKYTGAELSELVAGAIADGGLYTEATWKAYQDALAAAKDALKDAGNIGRDAGEKLAADLLAARDALVFNTTASDRAAQAAEDAQAIYGGGTYTAVSRKAYDEALAALKVLVDMGEKSPEKLTPAMEALEAAGENLVDVSALVAERDEFAKTDAAAYTAASFDAYQQVFDDSTPLLEEATAEQVAAAVEALRGARAGLVVLDLDALIAECEKLSQADYTEASWNAFGTALAAAKAGKDGADAPHLAQELASARVALVNVVALNDAIARAESIDASRFTADSVAALNKAVVAGKAALKAGSAEEVEAARQAILSALDGLAANGGTGGAGNGGSTGNGGNVGGNSGNSNGGGSTGNADNNGAKPNGGLPTTGDDSMVPIFVVGVAGAAVVIAGVIVALRHRK